MDWAMLGAIGELIGALAVVLSLLYVGRQVQNSNTMARSAVRQELSSEANTWAMSIASQPGLAATFAKVHFGGLTRDDATELERVQVAYAFVALIGRLQMAFTETADGVLSHEELDGLVGRGSTLLQAPYLKTLWPVLRPAYNKSFATWFEHRYDLTSN